MKKLGIILGCVVILVGMMVGPGMAKGGFDEYGYNYNARIFNGLAENWFRQQIGVPAWQEGDPYEYGAWGPAHLVMKWDKLWDNARFGPDDIKGSGDESKWASGAWCTNHWRWTDPDTGEVWVWYYRIVVAPLDPPPSDDAEDIKWGHPIAEDDTVLCFWAIFRVESGTGPFVGPAQPNGPGAYK